MTSAEANEPIICISQVFNPTIVRVVDHFRGGFPDLFYEILERFGFGFSACYHPVLLVDELGPFGIVSFDGSFFVFFSQVLNEHIKFVQVPVRQDRTDRASYNVAKKVLEFEYQEEIPRSRLQAAYGDGFNGAPLRCHASSEGAFSREAAIRDGEVVPSPSPTSSSSPTVLVVGGSDHV